jgi:hypothetical protein
LAACRFLPDGCCVSSCVRYPPERRNDPRGNQLSTARQRECLGWSILDWTLRRCRDEQSAASHTRGNRSYDAALDWAANIGMRTSGTQFRVSICHDNALNGAALMPWISIVPPGLVQLWAAVALCNQLPWTQQPAMRCVLKTTNAAGCGSCARTAAQAPFSAY